MSETVPARPESDNTDPPAGKKPAPPAAAEAGGHPLHVYYVHHIDNAVRPYLVVSANEQDECTDWGNLLGHNLSHRRLGTTPAPADPWPLNLDYERAAWAAFGDHDGPGGRPCGVQCADDPANELLVADVAAALWTWPRFATPGTAGGPTAENVAAAVRRHPADVLDVFERFKLADPADDSAGASAPPPYREPRFVAGAKPRPARPPGVPHPALTRDEPAGDADGEADDAEDYADFACYIATNADGQLRPRLLVVDAAGDNGENPDPRKWLFGDMVEFDRVGEVAVKVPALTAEIEAAAFRTYGDNAARLGRPATAEYLDPNPFDVAAGKVAVALATWPALAPAHLEGMPPTADVVAAALQVCPADVRDTFAKFEQLKRDAAPARDADRDAGLGDAARLGFLRADAAGEYDLTPAGRAVADLARGGTLERVGAALADWPLGGRRAS